MADENDERQGRWYGFWLTLLLPLCGISLLVMMVIYLNHRVRGRPSMSFMKGMGKGLLWAVTLFALLVGLCYLLARGHTR